MSPMRRTDHDFTGTTNGGYRFNVCGNTVKLCNQMPAPASKWRHQVQQSRRWHHAGDLAA